MYTTIHLFKLLIWKLPTFYFLSAPPPPSFPVESVFLKAREFKLGLKILNYFNHTQTVQYIYQLLKTGDAQGEPRFYWNQDISDENNWHVTFSCTPQHSTDQQDLTLSEIQIFLWRGDCASKIHCSPSFNIIILPHTWKHPKEFFFFFFSQRQGGKNRTKRLTSNRYSRCS